MFTSDSTCKIHAVGERSRKSGLDNDADTILVAVGSVAPTTAVRGNVGDDWPSSGRDFTNQRFSPLSQFALP